MEFYEIKNWKRFQHYKDRNPPWIKLHYELLTSEDWVMLADASKLLAVACMLIASRYEGRVPNNPELIKRIARIEGEIDFSPLLACGFFQAASTVLANACAIGRGIETEKEKRSERPASRKSVSGNHHLRGHTLADYLRAHNLFGVPPEWKTHMRSAMQKKGRSVDIEHQSRRFEDFFMSGKGSRIVKEDWASEYVAWIEKAFEPK